MNNELISEWISSFKSSRPMSLRHPTIFLTFLHFKVTPSFLLFTPICIPQNSSYTINWEVKNTQKRISQNQFFCLSCIEYLKNFWNKNGLAKQKLQKIVCSLLLDNFFFLLQIDLKKVEVTLYTWILQSFFKEVTCSSLECFCMTL